MTESNGEMFKAGDRVVISTEYHWAKGVHGVILQFCERNVQTKKGLVCFYVVEFDTPQDDDCGDGPYVMAEIDSTFLPREQEP